MKKTTSIFLLVGSVFLLIFTIYSFEKDSNIVSQKGKVCDLEQKLVCAIDGKTYDNKCLAGDKEIDYIGECIGFIPTKEQRNKINEIIKKLEIVIAKKGEKLVSETLYKINDKVKVENNLKHKYYIKKLMTVLEK